MELDEAIRGRRSIRQYTTEQIPDKDIMTLIEAGIWAPSACNRQDWRFIVINDHSIFKQLVYHGAASFLTNTHQAIMVIYKNTTDNIEYMDYVQSSAACIQNIQLKAHEMGIGTCWINFLPPKKTVRKILHIPQEYDPIALISIGYYDKTINDRPRKKPLEKIVSHNYFNADWSSPSHRTKPIIRRVLRKLYFIYPFKKQLSIFLNKTEKKFDN